MHKVLIFPILFLCPAFAAIQPWTLESFEASALENDPTLKEQRFSQKLVDYESELLLKQAILPRFQLSTALGPAPGISQKIDSSTVSGHTIYRTTNEYNFEALGPYFGLEFEFAQPLNIERLHMGLAAERANSQVKSFEIRQQEVNKSQSFQEAYHQLQFALTMQGILHDVQKDLDKVRKDLQSKSDSGDNDAANQILEIDAGAFELDEGQAKVEEGLVKAKNGFRFLTNQATDTILLSDSILTIRKEHVPSIDSLWLFCLNHNTDLGELRSGLKAKKLLADIKSSSVGPDFFLFGNVTFAKSWARDRSGSTGNVFQQDPLNTFSGSLGIGARFDLNLWYKNAQAKMARLELEQLQKKGIYADSGIRTQLQDLYFHLELNRKRVLAAQKAANASDALLTNAASVFDVDPSQGKPLIDAYKRNVTNRKTFYGALLDYNISLSQLIAKLGITLEEYRNYFGLDTQDLLTQNARSDQ